MMQWIKMLGLAFAAIVVGAVISEIPPFPGWFKMVDAYQTPWLVATGSSAVLGFALMMGGILDLIMAQDRTLTHQGAEDVERSVRLAAQPVAWRTTSYRVWGRATGREGSDEFTFREMKQAWRRGAWYRETVWRRRFITATGAALLTIGLFGIAFTLGPSPIKAIIGAVMLYACAMLARGFWRA
ncbi:MAG: hypothetical protein EHM80_11215 [Nitrospiraceae bacterium]|nr:MAG: hypothetical protein EHM80_11215 [Nitrospiraceae bacterium]